MGGLLLVTGPPGAGKSTVARTLAEMHAPSALVEGDAFFAFLRNGAISPWLPEAHEQNRAVTEAAAAASGRLAAHCEVFYEGIVGPWLLPEFLEASGRRALDYVVLLPPLEVCLTRVDTRREHDFDDPRATEHMWDAFSRAAVEGRHVIADEDRTPAEVARTIALRRAEEVLRFP